MKFKLGFSILLAILLPLTFSLLATPSLASPLSDIGPYQATATQPPAPTATPAPTSTPLPTSSVTVVCNPTSVVYTGTAQTPCTASYTTSDGIGPVGLTVTYSANINVGTATASASWGGDGGHTGSNGTNTFDITPATADCSGLGAYNVPYDGSSHTASGSCSGVNGETPGFTGTTHTPAGTYTDSVTLTSSNYILAAPVTLTDIISQVNASCTISPDYNGVYDGKPHGASGSCTIQGSSTGLSGLVFSAPFTDVPGGKVTWSLVNSNVSNPPSGTVNINITPASTSVTVDCAPGKFTYTGSEITPCKATVKGSSGPLNEALTADELTYSNNIVPGTASVTAAYPGDDLGDYSSSTKSATFEIDKAPADCSSIQFPTVTYDGKSHSYSGACYVDGVAQDTLNVTNGSATNAGDYTLTYNLNNPYYSGSGSLNYKILPFTPTCNITAYPDPTFYDGNPHTATGTCTGVDTTLAGLDLSGTTRTNAGTYTDPWTFTTTDTNYTNTHGTVTDTIAKADATCTITPYNGLYTGTPHGLTGTCSGIPSEPTLSDLNLGDTFTNVPGGPATWALTNPNYNTLGAPLTVVINPVTTICTVTPYQHVPYKGSDYFATGSCTGVNNESPALDLSVSTKHTDAGTYHDTWSMTDTNYNLDTGNSTSTSITDIIDPANATCNISPSYAVFYDGSTHGASGSCTTAGGVVASGLDLGTPGGPTVGIYHIIWSFSNPNYHITNAPSGSLDVTINKKAASVSAVAASKIYGAADPIPLPTTKSGFVAADLPNITFPVTRAPGENVGTYPITPTQPTGTPVSNYTITLNNAVFTITKANPDCSSIKGYTIDYDGNPHNPIPPGACLGVNGETLAGLTPPPSHTLPSASDYIDSWTFVDVTGNYINANGSVHDHINYLAANCSVVTGYNVPFDNTPHTAIFSCDKPGTLTGTTHTFGGTYHDTWIFTSTDGIYQATGTVTDTITRAPTTTTVTCPPGPFLYTSVAIIPPCTALTTGAGSLNQSVTMSSQSAAAYSYGNNTNASPPSASATYNFAQNANYAASTNTATFQITPAPSITTITCPASVPYTGSAQTPCAATVTGVGGLNLTNFPVTYGNNTAIGTATADAAYDPVAAGDHNHAASSDHKTFQIAPPTLTCTVPGYSVTYDGNPHTATGGTCITSDGKDFSSGLNESGTTHTNAGTYSDTWSFSDSTGAWPNQTGPVTDTIAKAAATCDASFFTFYNGPYTGTPHGGAGKCVGVKGEDLSSLITFTGSYINATNFGFVTWTFQGNANYTTAKRFGIVVITKANVTCTATGAGTYPYDGLPHAASVTCNKGLLGEDLSASVHLSSPSSFTAAPGGTVTWTFTNTNYQNPGGTISIVITLITATVKVTCPVSVVYNGVAQNPCTAVATDGTGWSVTLSVTYAGNTTNVGPVTASAKFAGDASHNPAQDSTTFTITPADLKCTITGYTVDYDGTPHTITTYSCDQPGTLSAPTHTNAGTYADSWNFTPSSGNYKKSSSVVTDVISKIDATCSVTGYSVNYDGASHTATGACTSPIDGTLTGLDLSGTTHTDAGTYSDSWSFTNDNYNDASDNVTDIIAPIAAVITVTCPTTDQSYTGLPLTPCSAQATDAFGLNLDITASLVYTNNTDVGMATASVTFTDINHSASSGSATFNISGVTSTVTVTCPTTDQPYTGLAQTPCSASYTTTDGLSGPLTPTYSNNIDAGTAIATASYLGDANHNGSSNTADFTISPVAATCTVTPYTVAYDGNPHTATGVCTGLGGASVTGLSFPAHTNAGIYSNDHWTFTNIDYTNPGDYITDTITRGSVTCTITPYTVAFDGNAHTATGTCVGAKGETLSGLDLSGTNHTDPGNYTDTWTFTDLITGNYANTSGPVSDSIVKADATCNVTPYTVAFDGVAHTATGTCTGVRGVSLTGLDLSGTTHTDAGDYPGDTWTFNNTSGNYNALTGIVHDRIGQPTVTCTVTPYTVAYDGTPHTATGYCVGVGGVTVAGINLTGTSHTDGGDYPGDTWTFTDATGNYANSTGTVHDSITKIGASCSVNPYNVVYDGTAHTATGSCTGLRGVSVSGLDLGGTTHTDAGDYPDDGWTLKNTNYFASDSVHDVIHQTTATCSVTGYTGVYDGLSHGASGSCISASGSKLPGLNLGEVYKSVPGGSANWNFLNPNVSNAPLAGSVDITLTQASSTVTVTCPASLPYTGSALTPCTATATGPGGLKQDLTVSYSNNIDIGTATASASFAGDINHTGSTGSGTFFITPVTLAGAPLVGGEGTSVAKNLKGESGAGLDEKAAVLAALVTGTPLSTALPISTKAPVNSALGVDVKAQNTNNSSGKSRSNNFWATYSGLFGCIGTVFLAMLIFFMFKRRRDDDGTEENGAADKS